MTQVTQHINNLIIKYCYSKLNTFYCVQKILLVPTELLKKQFAIQVKNLTILSVTHTFHFFFILII